jgi:hypothetical protein
MFFGRHLLCCHKSLVGWYYLVVVRFAENILSPLYLILPLTLITSIPYFPLYSYSPLSLFNLIPMQIFFSACDNFFLHKFGWQTFLVIFVAFQKKLFD